MRILMLDEEFPFPLDTGKRIRTFQLTTALGEENEITYLAYGVEDSDSFRALKERGIEPIAVKRPHQKKSGLWFYCKLLLNIFSRYPFIVTNHYSRRFQNAVHRLLAERQFDVVIAEWTPYTIFVQQKCTAVKIAVAHNIESSIWRRYEENETNFFKKLYIMHQRSKVELYENKCYRWVDGATAVSHEEAREIEKHETKYRVATIENGVDLDFFKPMDIPTLPDRMVFTGSMDWRPNQDAMIWFVEEILPLIRKERPKAELYIVGRRPPRKVEALNDRPGVTVTGRVPDVRRYVAEASVYVVPLRIGGGSRLKILEAMAMKKAVVSTSVGAEGIETVDGETILLADGAEAFARRVLDVMTGRVDTKPIANRAHHLVESTYQWSHLAGKLQAYLERTVASR